MTEPELKQLIKAMYENLQAGADKDSEFEAGHKKGLILGLEMWLKAMQLESNKINSPKTNEPMK